MKEWYEVIPRISTYNPDIKKYPQNVVLSESKGSSPSEKRLSPLTNLLFNVFFNATNKKKNLICAFPDAVLRPIPIISYIYCHTAKKSTFVFTQEKGGNSPAAIHNMNYYLLNKTLSGDYLFKEIPIGYMYADGSVDAKVRLPRIAKKNRKEYILAQKENFPNGAGAKILLYADESNSRISDVINKIVLDEGNLDNLHIGIEIGMVIFENVDRFIYNSYSLKVFLEWIHPLLERGTRLLFHFSNPLSQYIQRVKEETDSYVLQFSPSLLRYNTVLRESSRSYFNRIRHDEENFINRYNIDRSFFYSNTSEIEILFPPLPSGNIDKYISDVKSLCNKIDEEELVNKKQYYSLLSLSYKLPNLSVNPSRYKKCFYDPVLKNFRYYTIPSILEKLKESIRNEQEQNRYYLNEIVSEVYCLYSELKECKRYGEEASYSRVAKDYKILELLSEYAGQENDKNNVLLAAYSPIERGVINAEIEKLKLENKAYVEHIDALSRSGKPFQNKLFDRTKTILILPGPLWLKYISELFQPYNRIVILVYDGKNYESAKEQIDLISACSTYKEGKAISYLEEIYLDLGLPKDGLFKDFSDRKSVTNQTKDENKEIPEKIATKETKTGGEEDSILAIIKKELIARAQTSKSSKELLQEDTNVEHIERQLIVCEQKDYENQTDVIGECYEVMLEKFDETAVVRRRLLGNKSYFRLKKNEEPQECYPEELSVNDYIVLLGNDERKTFLDLILEISGLEESVDKFLLSAWREKLKNFIDKQDLHREDGCELKDDRRRYREKLKSAYKKYKENGGTVQLLEFENWVKDKVIGPEGPKELLAIGKMMDDEEIIDNWELINQEVKELRKIHRETGRKIRNVVEEILKGTFDRSKLSLEEHMLYEQIHDNIYRIIGIRRITNEKEGEK